MVFVKIRETFDLHTVKDKMTLIGIHTPKASLIAKNFPGLLMQCKAYRPVSADVTVACASMLPADPLQVSTNDGDIAPEDLFNPILYKATTNFGLSQIEARIHALGVTGNTSTVNGDTAQTVNTGISAGTDFDIYYGLLADSHGWKHANPQAGLSMTGLQPLVYELLYSIGDNSTDFSTNTLSNSNMSYPNTDNSVSSYPVPVFKGHAKPMPFINCTAYNSQSFATGFDNSVNNHSAFVPSPRVYCGLVIVPPSRLHELFYRMVVTWTIEFSGIRTIGEIGSFADLATIGNNTHRMDYDFSSAKQALGLEETKVDENDAGSVSANVDVTKVM